MFYSKLTHSNPKNFNEVQLKGPRSWLTAVLTNQSFGLSLSSCAHNIVSVSSLIKNNTKTHKKRKKLYIAL